MTEKEEKAFLELLEKDADKREILHQLTAQRLKSADEYETLDLYGKTDK
jgi:CRP-like cAMP-binding protein